MITSFCGRGVFPIGIGTWGMGGWMSPDYSNDKEEVKALKYALSNHINLIDTAEIYGRGHAEELVAQAIKGKEREKLFITSKVWPGNYNHDKLIRAAENSLKRLNTKYLDLYLMHWPIPGMNINELMGAMEELVDKGTIRNIGVSNFGVKDVERAMLAMKKHQIAANQIHYSLLKRDPEDYIIPFCIKNKITIMAYTPLEKGRVVKVKEVIEMAEKYKKTPIQIAINYLMKKSLPIPKASSAKHIKEILGSVGWGLSSEDYKKLSQI